MKLKYKCEDGTEIYVKQGKKSENDFKIYTKFPNQERPWPHTLEYAGAILRLKAEVEEINYPRFENGQRTKLRGKHFLWHFIQECIVKTQTPIQDLVRKFKIPVREYDN